eukprot:7560492-Ditylum_brightwellii.AAC.1
MFWEAIGPNGNSLWLNVLLLPTRSLELNPIELIFHTLVQRLKTLCIKGQNIHRDAAAVFAAKVFDEMDHDLIINIMIYCGY